jgi:hypothetical protein
VLDGTSLSVRMGEGDIMQVRMVGFTPSRDFQSLISEEAPEDLPEPMIDPFVEEDQPSETDAGIPTLPFSERSSAELAAQEAEEAEEADQDEGEDDMDGMADLLAMIPLLGLLALFM